MCIAGPRVRTAALQSAAFTSPCAGTSSTSHSQCGGTMQAGKHAQLHWLAPAEPCSLMQLTALYPLLTAATGCAGQASAGCDHGLWGTVRRSAPQGVEKDRLRSADGCAGTSGPGCCDGVLGRQLQLAPIPDPCSLCQGRRHPAGRLPDCRSGTRQCIGCSWIRRRPAASGSDTASQQISGMKCLLYPDVRLAAQPCMCVCTEPAYLRPGHVCY